MNDILEGKQETTPEWLLSNVVPIPKKKKFPYLPTIEEFP